MRTYGYIRDTHDPRDLKFSAAPGVIQTLPARVDLRPNCPPVYDQGEIGSCTANAIAAAHQFEQMKQKNKLVVTPSRLFIYFNERVIEGTVSEDAGAMLRDGMKTVAQQGVCKEGLWPYYQQNLTKKPGTTCYADGMLHQVTSYKSVAQDLQHLKACLASGYPFVFGIQVYQSFESDGVAANGLVPMPIAHEKCLGGHAICCVGYDDATQRFIVRNSWGITWGDKGYCYLPYAYLTNFKLASDFWQINLVEA